MFSSIDDHDDCCHFGSFGFINITPLVNNPNTRLFSLKWSGNYSPLPEDKHSEDEEELLPAGQPDFSQVYTYNLDFSGLVLNSYSWILYRTYCNNLTHTCMFCLQSLFIHHVFIFSNFSFPFLPVQVNSRFTQQLYHDQSSVKKSMHFDLA